MNYFAHGYRFIEDPYLLAGTAVPDWLSVADRRVRTRPSQAAEFATASDPQVAAVARGIAQHHHDDAWFHNTEAFNQLSWKLAVLCRDALPTEEGVRPSVLGHILLELLLDAALIERNPALLDKYYAAMETVDPTLIERTVNALARNTTDRLAWFIDRFRQVRFLYDYADDAKLLFRLNQVLFRVQLPPLQEAFVGVIAAARQQINAQAAELLLENNPEQKRLAG
ncbi:MAG TPA: hypothetical protein VFE46_01825 [Pirellulales bacterium]|jgi:hypothetical protein|nr:hypothetical protein [Pirellulales bacterium]